MGTLAALLSRLDLEPARRGRQFEAICHWYLTHDPLYARQLKRVWPWKDWPGRWGADAGIDLVAEGYDGGLWAIQTKAYDPRYSIKKSDVDTFLSESSRALFSFRLLVATTNEIGVTAKRTLGAQEKPGHVLFLADLERAVIEWPRSPDDLVARPPKSKRPRPHQRRAIRDVARGFENADRGQLLMACGTGKTLTALWVVDQLGSERTLVLLPSLSLLAQTLREWVANANEEFSFLPVCSDETVSETDSAISKTADLAFPVTTDPGEIGSFLRKRGPRVVFSTYQSSPQVAAAMKGRVPGFDLAVADEAHRCAGRVSGDFATILDDEVIRAKRRLFMTATPRYFTGRIVREAAELDLEIASMDNEAQFGPVFHRLTFAEAIDGDLLSDYQVAVVVVDDDTCRGYAERGTFVTTDGESVTDAKTLASQIGVAKAMRRYDLRRVVSFHSRVKWARDFSRSLPGVIGWMPPSQRPRGALWSDYVSGEMPSGHRDVLLGRLRDLDGERGLLCNARCLAEGVDVPTLDGVAFIDPRRSEVDVVQAVGRAIRKSPEKKIGTVVLPVFMKRGDDTDSVLGSSAFKHVWEVLKALRAHDEQLAEELDELRREMGYRRTSAGRAGKIKLLLPVGVGVDFARAFDTRLVEHTTSRWEFWFGLLGRFVQREGHALVPHQHEENSFRLGQWVFVQRRQRLLGLLPLDREDRLSSVEGWVWSARQNQWATGFERLQCFVSRESHALVPFDHHEDGFALGQWVNAQRNRFRDRRLSGERVRALEAIEGWVWDARDDAWLRGYQVLERYSAKAGHSSPRALETLDGFKIGSWVNTQRNRRKLGRLSLERQRLLDALPGWSWDERDASWERAFSYLHRFAEREGHVRVPADYVEDGFRLERWVVKQRSSRGRAQLVRFRPERYERLTSLQGWSWDPLVTKWESNFAALTRFVDREGHARVPYAHIEDGLQLGWWVGNQRQFHRRGELARDRVERLERLQGWTWKARGARV